MDANRPVTLLEATRRKIRLRHYSVRTERAYVYWIRQFVRYCGMRHPRDVGADEIEAFLTHLAMERAVSASTQNQAFSAILFLYRQVLERELPRLEGVKRAK